ncbi:MAG: lipid-A-disaccharide synthase, partial [Nitrosopumilus sp.]
AEAALRGIPTLSYKAVPNIIEEYLVKKKLVIRINDVSKLDKKILRILTKKSNSIKNLASKEFKSMENPIKKLELVLRMLNE